MHRPRLGQLLVASALALLAACQPKTLPMTPEEAQRIALLTERMTIRCVGRYLIELPEKFVLNAQSVTEIEGVKIFVRPMARSRFDLLFDSRRRALEAAVQLGEKWPHLRRVIPLASPSVGAVFDRAESTDSTGRLSRTFELLAWQEGFEMKASINATDTTFAEYADDSVAKQLKTDVEEKLGHLLEVYGRLRGRVETEIPAERGFCFPGGFMKGVPSEDEQTYVPFHLEGSPDLYFHFAAKPERVKEKERLLERAGKVEREMNASGTQTIRKGVVELNGLRLDEWLFKGPTPDEVPGTMFTLVGNESSPGATSPFVRFELFNGFEIPAPERTAEESAQHKKLTRATLSEAEAVALWGKVIATLRLRPGAF